MRDCREIDMRSDRHAARRVGRPTHPPAACWGWEDTGVQYYVSLEEMLFTGEAGNGIRIRVLYPLITVKLDAVQTDSTLVLDNAYAHT